MKHQMFNRLRATACLVAGMVSAAPLLAATTGSQYLRDPYSIDVFKLKCPAKSLGLMGDVMDLPSIGNPAIVIMDILKDGYIGTSDNYEGFPGSQRVILDNGSGQYHVVVRQVGGGGGAEDYSGLINCRKSPNGFPIPPVPGSFQQMLDQ